MPSVSDIRAGRAYVEVGADLTEMQKKLAGAQTQFQDWGKNIASIGAPLTAIGGSIAGSMLLFTKTFADSALRIEATAKQTGVAAEQIQKLEYAARQTGVSTEDFDARFVRLTKTIFEAQNGSKEAQAAFAELGISLNDLKDKTPEQQFGMLADRIKLYPDYFTKASGAMELFGRGGSTLLPVLELGSSGIKTMGDQAAAIAGIMSTDDVKAGADFARSLQNVVDSSTGLTRQIGAALAPMLTKLADSITRSTAKMAAFAQSNRGLTVVVFEASSAIAGLGSILFATGITLQGITIAIGGLRSAIAFATIALTAFGYQSETMAARAVLAKVAVIDLSTATVDVEKALVGASFAAKGFIAAVTGMGILIGIIGAVKLAFDGLQASADSARHAADAAMAATKAGGYVKEKNEFGQVTGGHYVKGTDQVAAEAAAAAAAAAGDNTTSTNKLDPEIKKEWADENRQMIADQKEGRKEANDAEKKKIADDKQYMQEIRKEWADENRQMIADQKEGRKEANDLEKQRAKDAADLSKEQNAEDAAEKLANVAKNVNSIASVGSFGANQTLLSEIFGRSSGGPAEETAKNTATIAQTLKDMAARTFSGDASGMFTIA